MISSVTSKWQDMSAVDAVSFNSALGACHLAPNVSSPGLQSGESEVRGQWQSKQKSPLGVAFLCRFETVSAFQGMIF